VEPPSFLSPAGTFFFSLGAAGTVTFPDDERFSLFYENPFFFLPRFGACNFPPGNFSRTTARFFSFSSPSRTKIVKPFFFLREGEKYFSRFRHFLLPRA